MKNLNKGFTLVELLIVIAIIGILAVAFLPSVMGAPSKARDAQRVEQINKLADYFTLQYAVTGTLPGATTAAASYAGDQIKQFIDLADFGGVFPEDPGDTNYRYLTIPGNSTPYVGSVYGLVENEENGNVVDNIHLVDFLNGTVSATDSGTYYVVAIQK